MRNAAAFALFLLTALALIVSAEEGPIPVTIQFDDETGRVDFLEAGRPFLRFNHGPTQVPAGIDPKYRRGNYVSALWGPHGELLTEDYPADHPHHRAVNWSWATIQWREETRDLFAISGIWARPSRFAHASGGPEAGVIEAESRWMWDDKEPVVRERVIMRAHRATDDGRYIDFEIQLTALVDDLQFAGRLEAGYSGFNIRMAPGRDQQIRLHNADTNAPGDATPQCSWGDYSAVFDGMEGPSGIAIFQHVNNPAYPSEWLQYPPLNFFQPAYPGGRLIPMPKGETITLRYRLWIHEGVPTEDQLAKRWAVYNETADMGATNGEKQP